MYSKLIAQKSVFSFKIPYLLPNPDALAILLGAAPFTQKAAPHCVLNPGVTPPSMCVTRQVTCASDGMGALPTLAGSGILRTVSTPVVLSEWMCCMQASQSRRTLWQRSASGWGCGLGRWTLRHQRLVIAYVSWLAARRTCGTSGMQQVSVAAAFHALEAVCNLQHWTFVNSIKQRTTGVDSLKFPKLTSNAALT